MSTRKLTTSRGKCRTCLNEWRVKKTSVSPERLVRLPGGLSYMRGLPITCPACNSSHISWIYDNPRHAPRRPAKA